MPKSNNPAHLARLEEQAPDRCEICDSSLSTFASRLEHIEDTGHCACADVDCWGYIPPGYVSQHFSAMHAHEDWNEHQVSGGDASTLRDALPWVREAYKKRFEGMIDFNEWLGMDKHEGKPESLKAFLRMLAEGEKKFLAERLAERKKFVQKKNEEQIEIE
jgi:hypothetical protein